MFEPTFSKLGEYARAAGKSTDALWALDSYIQALTERDKARALGQDLDNFNAEVAACRGELEFQIERASKLCDL